MSFVCISIFTKAYYICMYICYNKHVLEKLLKSSSYVVMVNVFIGFVFGFVLVSLVVEGHFR